MGMKPPANTTLPFFAYGLFKPRQLGFLQLKDLVCKVTEGCETAGTLLLRDGLPILNKEGRHERTVGFLLQFKSDASAEEAYCRIAKMEPEKQYRWEERIVSGSQSNLLLGISPSKGSTKCAEGWDGESDPLFTAALEVVKETLDGNSKFDWNFKPLFRLEMAYLLLWSAIERYMSLRYGLGDKPMKKIDQLAQEPALRSALMKHVKESRLVVRADDPTENVRLNQSDPKKALCYYYQVRSNLVHRGKGVQDDHDKIYKSGIELLEIFRDVLEVSFEESNWVAEAH